MRLSDEALEFNCIVRKVVRIANAAFYNSWQVGVIEVET